MDTTLPDVVNLDLPSGAKLLIEGVHLGGSEKVSTADQTVRDVLTVVREFAGELGQSIQATGATSWAIEFGVSVAFESGKAIAMIAKGSSNVNLKVTIGFER